MIMTIMSVTSMTSVLGHGWKRGKNQEVKE